VISEQPTRQPSERLSTRRAWLGCVLPLLLLQPGLAAASDAPSARPAAAPRVVLDRLELPPGLAGTRYEKRLRKVLASETKKADWGAGSSSTIEFRFKVVTLKVTHDSETLRVHCEAVGRLPHGGPALSQLAYGGRLDRQSELIEEVLTIVARGVVTRLAEMERVRRGRQGSVRVKLPAE
jgi:hypothetical protein